MSARIYSKQLGNISISPTFPNMKAKDTFYLWRAHQTKVLFDSLKGRKLVLCSSGGSTIVSGNLSILYWPTIVLQVNIIMICVGIQ